MKSKDFLSVLVVVFVILGMIIDVIFLWFAFIFLVLQVGAYIINRKGD